MGRGLRDGGANIRVPLQQALDEIQPCRTELLNDGLRPRLPLVPARPFPDGRPVGACNGLGSIYVHTSVRTHAMVCHGIVPQPSFRNVANRGRNGLRRTYVRISRAEPGARSASKHADRPDRSDDLQKTPVTDVYMSMRSGPTVR